MFRIFIFIMIIYINLEAKKSVLVENIKNNIQIDSYIVNNNLFDITIKYTPKYKNLISSETFPIIKSIKSKSRIKMATFYTNGKSYSLNINTKWAIGNKNSIHNDNYLYTLPYEVNTKQKVTQGFNGYFSHKGNSLYAVDFGLKENTKIYASREGIVVQIKNDGFRHGSKKYIKDANFILIKHNDGTYCKYVHLKKGGVKVKIGQNIKKGQFIGFSGNTGYTNGPHLHFLVFKGKSYNSRQSIKIKFISKNGIINNPIRGKIYTAVK